jgi:hypothetical protein
MLPRSLQEILHDESPIDKVAVQTPLLSEAKGRIPGAAKPKNQDDPFIGNRKS